MALICEHNQRRAHVEPSALHTLRATPQNVHWGYFDPAQAPSLTVKSGDLVVAEAITHHAGDAPELMMDDAVWKIFKEIPEEDRNPGVHIPMSCEVGVCGSCRTRVLAGVPDHRDLLLSPEEQAANNEFTPCCSRSKTPLLVLDL